MRIVLALTAAMLVMPASALAGTPAPGTTAPARINDGDKIICKSERMVGSNLSTRICHTKAEWDAAREADKRTLDRRNGEQVNPTRRGDGG